MSLIDYQRDTLSPKIWDLDTLTLREDVKNFICSLVVKFFSELLGVPSSDVLGHVVKDILIASSLASYFYTDTSDLDIKIIYSDDALRLYVPDLLTNKDLASILTRLGRKRILNKGIPGTKHFLDPFFISENDAKNLNYLKFDSLYSVFQKSWLKLPKHLNYVDMLKMIQLAKEKAEPFLEKVHEDIEELRRDSIDFIILYDFLKQLPSPYLSKFKEYISENLKKIDEDLAVVITDKQLLKRMREHVFSKKELETEFEKLMGSFNYSDENLIYKFMSRYGYLKILSRIEHILKRRGTYVQ